MQRLGELAGEVGEDQVGAGPLDGREVLEGHGVAVGVEDEECVKFFSLPAFELLAKVPIGKMFNDHIVLTKDGKHVLVANFYSDDVVGIDRFGASAPGDVAMRELGFTVDNVVTRALALLGITTELAAILFFFCSVPPGSRRIVEVEPIVLTMTPEAKAETPALEAPTPPAARQIAAPKKTATKAKAKTKALPAPAITDRMDGRTIAGMRKRAANLA